MNPTIRTVLNPDGSQDHRLFLQVTHADQDPFPITITVSEFGGRPVITLASTEPEVLLEGLSPGEYALGRRVIAELGDRIELVTEVERFPHFTAPAGARGTVTDLDDSSISVKMDDHLPGAEAWDNEIVWSDDAHPHSEFDSAVKVVR